MQSFSIVWLCANNLSKAESDIKKIKLYLNEKSLDLNIEFIIFDRLSKEIIQQEWIENRDTQIKYLRSSRSINIYKDLTSLIKRSNSTYIMLLPDDDKIYVPGMLQFFKLISKLPKKSIFLAIPHKKIYKGVNFNKLISGKKYTFWQYQYQRGYNLAYYSPILREQLELTIDNIINSSQDNWYYPNWDQVILWIFLEKGKKYIYSLDGFYLYYDNIKWESKDNKLLSYKKMESNFLKNFYYSLNQIFSITDNFSDILQVIRWFKFLLFYQSNILKNLYYIPSFLIIFLKILIMKLKKLI